MTTETLELIKIETGKFVVIGGTEKQRIEIQELIDLGKVVIVSNEEALTNNLLEQFQELEKMFKEYEEPIFENPKHTQVWKKKNQTHPAFRKRK